MDTITLDEVEVFWRVGVPDEERAVPQRLLLSIRLSVDTRPAAATDDLAKTVDYFALHQRLHALGDGREWRLIETLAADVAKLALDPPAVRAVRVTVQKFVLPATRSVAVTIIRTRPR